ncbi:unnamed protein product [Boreogadus saida]
MMPLYGGVGLPYQQEAARRPRCSIKSGSHLSINRSKETERNGTNNCCRGGLPFFSCAVGGHGEDEGFGCTPSMNGDKMPQSGPGAPCRS